MRKTVSVAWKQNWNSSRRKRDAAPAQKQRVRELAQVSHLTRELAVLLVRRVIVGTKDPLTGQQEITIEWAF